ncbi:hypothetical protein QUF72_20155 [Desulfobacterales bacterium HSG2]|nr:hypothetical protein [Desulfobacterales bacterium HSG2]
MLNLLTTKAGIHRSGTEKFHVTAQNTKTRVIPAPSYRLDLLTSETPAMLNLLTTKAGIHCSGTEKSHVTAQNTKTRVIPAPSYRLDLLTSETPAVDPESGNPPLRN